MDKPEIVKTKTGEKVVTPEELARQKREREERRTKAAERLPDEVVALQDQLAGVRKELAEARADAIVAKEEAKTSRAEAKDAQNKTLEIQTSIKNANWVRAYLAVPAFIISLIALVVSVCALFKK